MNEGAVESGSDIREYLAILRARKWTIVITACLLLAAALGYSALQTPLYTAGARVLVQPLASPGSTAGAPVDVQTESQVIDSEPVADLVVVDLDTNQSADALLGNLDVRGASTAQTSFSSAQVLQITYTSPDPRFAAQAANSFAESYIQYRKEQVLKSFLAAQSAVSRRVEAATDQLNDLSDQLDEATKAGDDSLVTTLETQRSVLISRLGVLQQRFDDLEPDQATRSGGGQVIQTAGVPGSPSSPNYLRSALLAIVAGLILGVGLASLRERMDDRLRGRAHVEEVLDAPVLATVPRFTKPKRNAQAQLMALSESKGVGGEAYRTLRTNLQFVAAQKGIKGFVITSPSAGEGKTVTTANLGVVLAQAGKRVIIVSADLRRPSLEGYFGLSNKRGLADYLLSTGEPLWNYLVDPKIPNLRILPSGPVPGNPAELLTTARMTETLEALQANCDYLLIDSPPVVPVADAAILASRVRGTVLVVDASSTHRSSVAHAREELERGGAVLLGSVLNAYDPGSSPYYYAPYYASYGYEPRPAPSTDVNGANEERGSTRSIFGSRG
jgi:non-specific protein-tyrosine kinase